MLEILDYLVKKGMDPFRMPEGDYPPMGDAINNALFDNEDPGQKWNAYSDFAFSIAKKYIGYWKSMKKDSNVLTASLARLLYLADQRMLIRDVSDKQFSDFMKKLIDECIANGYNINKPLVSDKLTLLMLSAGYNEIELVEWLVKKGADKTLRDIEGKTAREIAGKFARQPDEKKEKRISEILSR